MAEYVRIVGDTNRPIIATLRDTNGPIDLSDSDIVTFVTRKLDDILPTTVGQGFVIAPDVPVGHPDRGKVGYDLLANDVVDPGVYFVKWRVQFAPNPSTIVQSFPETSNGEVLILLPSM